MGFIQQIADLFRSRGSDPVTSSDRFGILTPLTETIDYLEKTKTYLRLFQSNTKITFLLKDKTVHHNAFQDKAKNAYQLYLRSLAPHDLAMEKQVGLSSAQAAIDSILGNLELIEDNFQKFFGDALKDPTSMRTSSLLVIGYIQTANAFGNWVTQLTNHFVPDDDSNITPFVTKELIDKAPMAGQFVSHNLGPWTPRYKGFLTLLNDLQKKGVDVVIRSDDTWLDSFINERQFSSTEQNLIIAGFNNPILSWATGRMIKQQEQLELAQYRKDWLISKIAMEEAKMHGMNQTAAEYAKLKRAIDYYSSMVSKQESKIERLRG
jgi:hypothetical protein